VTIKIRYNVAEVPARLYPLEGGRTRVVFDQPQAAISPGQAGVCYQGDLVLGGGWIERHEAIASAPVAW